MKSYEELLALFNEILEENKKLKYENAELKRQLGITESSITTPDLPEAVVTKHSSPQEKITLFRSLFHGRDDVFARRWYSEKTGKSGYQPVCGNEWAVGICDKRKYKCSVCPNRSLLPLTDRDIFNHLSGKDELCRDVIGIYPMLKDETCSFTAIDFDGTSFREDVTAVMKICEQYGIPAYTELVRDYGMIIVDECHHVSAVNFEKILRYANAKYVYGLTATPQRQDGQHPIIFMQCGPIRYRVDAKEQAEKRGFEHILIPRFTDFRSAAPNRGIAVLYKNLAESESRSEQIISDVKNVLLENRCPIILTERREHVHLLADKLSEHCSNTITLTGTASQKERQETMNQLHSIPADEPLVIIATGKYVGEGFDYPRLDTLFLALPIAWKGKVAQYAGRLHRNYAGKTEVQVYDYVDLHIPVLEKMYQKRLKGYASIGYKIRGSSAPSSALDLIYDGKNYLPAYEQDLQNAEKEILIVSPYLQSGRIKQFIKQISPAVHRQVSVVVVTRPIEVYKEKDRSSAENNLHTLREYGITVTEKSGVSGRFCVIDQRTVWYGSVNFLGFSSEEDSVMRLADEEIAGRLLDTVTGKN